MKIYMMLLGALIALLTGCKKEETIPEPIYNPLSGVYDGQVTYFGLYASGNVDPDYPVETHPVKFEIDGAKFNRAECGCTGSIVVDENQATAHFISSSKACEDGGSSNGQSWSFTNDIMGKFGFTIHGDTLELLGIPGSTKNPANMQKRIIAIRQEF
ncbi:hypothetical protein [Dyadobacter luticola]|uniref:META domain-containing protein n=1 Tax=Dyadobacter luticola TaxID=1979387 RepID=A0A5R9KLA4_9BACT|nr:hypothetical protein [Dyadobacter luticola]TLU96994.1 hypothetical protein FEN17_27120 [Dyadobacter luticola]